MAKSFGGSVKLKGESEYRKALREITSSLSVMTSELKVVTSQYDKNDRSVQNLSAQNEVLTRKIKEQSEKVEILKKALQDARDETGENSETSKKWERELNNAQAQLNTLNRQLENNKRDMAAAENATDSETKAVDDLGKEADKTGGKMESFGKAAAGALKAAAVAAAAVTASFVAIGKQAVELYADYEQLTGGVETLFKESSDIVKGYANEAYRTAGLSANEYMETVTGFSASLIQSLDGDTEKAAEMANMAIIDMADNANKMGSDISAIQSAYQGFAKQNYTMLDNLKLGYGGTKTEMERLLRDADALSDTFNLTTDENGKLIYSYADIVEAIHIVQTEMGITGTTAKEASSTIQGSLGAMKSAWQNLLTGVAAGDKSFDKLIGNMTDSVLTFGKNILPVVKQTISGLGQLVEGFSEELLPELVDVIPELASELIPIAISSAEMLIGSAVDALPELLNVGLTQVLPGLLTATIGITGKLLTSLTQALPQLMTTISSTAVELLNTLLSPENIQKAVGILIDCIKSVISGLQQSLPILIEGAIQLVSGLVSALPDVVNQLIEALPDIMNMIFDSEKGLLGKNNIKQLINGAVNLVLQLVENLPEIITSLLEALPDIIDQVVTALIDSLPLLIEGCIRLVIELVKHLPEIIKSLIDAMPQIIKSIANALLNGLGAIFEVGINLVKGLWEGIKSAASWLWNNITGWLSDIWEGILDFFGIHSPSAKMRDLVGKNLVLGLAQGIKDEGETAVKETERLAESISKIGFAPGTFDMPNTMSIALPAGNAAPVINSASPITFNIQISDVKMSSDQDVYDVANQLSGIIASQVMTLGGAYQ